MARSKVKIEKAKVEKARMLYVITQYLACKPHVEVWELIRETGHAYVVRMRDGTRSFKKGLPGNRYFLERAACAAHLQRVYALERDRALREAAVCKVLNELGEDALIAYARGDEAVALEVDRKALGRKVKSDA